MKQITEPPQSMSEKRLVNSFRKTQYQGMLAFSVRTLKPRFIFFFYAFSVVTPSEIDVSYTVCSFSTSHIWSS